MTTMVFGKALLLALSLYDHKSCKLVIYYQCLMEIIFEAGMPLDRGVVAVPIVLLNNVLVFFCCAFDFWPAAIMTSTV